MKMVKRDHLAGSSIHLIDDNADRMWHCAAQILHLLIRPQARMSKFDTFDHKSREVGNKWLIWLVLMMKSGLQGPFVEGWKKPSCVWQDDINLHCLERSPAARRCSASPGTSPAWGCIRPAVAPAAARWRSCRHRNGTTIWKKEGIKISYSESGLWYLIASLSKNWFLSLIVSFLAPYCWTRKN